MANLRLPNGTLNVELVNEILKDIKANHLRFIQAEELFKINEGELLPYVLRALSEELNPKAFDRASKRVSPINILPKVIAKLSSLYINGAVRKVEKDEDGATNVANNQEIVDYYSKELGLDPRMVLSQEQYNLNKYTALEPYLDTTKSPAQPKLRILPAHMFWVYSDNVMDPTEMTVFVKILGTYSKFSGEMKDDGTYDTTVTTVFMMYSATDIIAVDLEGELRMEFMQENPEGLNPFGEIPFVYISESEYKLIPNPNTDTKPLTILIPKLLTDLNYASQFASHSIIYAIDAKIDNLKYNPDEVWNISSEPTDDGTSVKTASIGSIKPEVNIPETLNLIKTQTQMWLDTLGLRASSVGDLSVENAASGISKLIDESDATAVRETQATKYKDVERDFWELMGKMHNTWLEMGEQLKENRLVSGELQVRVEFPPQDTIKDEEKLIRIEEMKLGAGLTSKRRALQALHPELDAEELEKLIAEIESENTIRVEAQQEEQEDVPRNAVPNSPDNNGNPSDDDNNL